MKEKKGDSFILLQLKDDRIKLVRCKEYDSSSPIEIDGFLVQQLQLSKSEETKTAVKDVLDEIAYHGEKVILLISHQKVSSRYFRFPSQDTKEIENMISLQASKILPYPAEEIFLGYQVVDRDQEGFSSVNVILLHKSAIEEIIALLQEFGVHIDSVYVDTYGMPHLLKPEVFQAAQEILTVIVDLPYITVSILKNQKICLSRFIKISQDQSRLQEELSKNIIETQGLYLRQGNTGPIKKVVLLASGDIATECKSALDQTMVVPVEPMAIPKDLNIKRTIEIDGFPGSLLDILGFVLKRPPESLNLLPPYLKEEKIRAKRAKDNIKIIALGLTSVFLLIATSLKYIDNKKIYDQSLSKELTEIQAQAKGLESMVKRLKILEASRREGTRLLDFFHAIHSTAPPGIIVTEIRFDSEQNTRFLLKGTSPKLDSVFAYASNLQGLELFDQEDIKVNYATNKESKKDEIVNFEIAFQNKK